MNQQQKSFKILLIGDSCYDIYHYGEVNRISPEAPVPIFDLKYTENKHGMASNVYQNLVNLGLHVECHTHFFENKHRYIDIKSKQQLMRMDERISTSKDFIFDVNWNDGYDAVVISDYGKGTFSKKLYDTTIKKYSGPIFMDTKDPDIDYFSKAYVKINQYELQKSNHKSHNNLIVTYGGDKVTYRDKTYIPPKVLVHDVCGAGDTFLAGLVYGYLAKDIEYGINFAMKSAAITVQHIGVYAPKLEEIL